MPGVTNTSQCRRSASKEFEVFSELASVAYPFDGWLLAAARASDFSRPNAVRAITAAVAQVPVTSFTSCFWLALVERARRRDDLNADRPSDRLRGRLQNCRPCPRFGHEAT